MRRAALLAAVLLCLPGAWCCETLQACLDLYPKAKPSAHGIGQDEVKLAEAVQKYGAEAVPYLIKLLDNGTENARQLAGYTLRDIDGLKPEHLPALIRARRRKGSLYARAGIADYWIVNLVGRVLEVYRDPQPAPGAAYDWAYRSMATLVPPAVIAPLGITDARIAVADLLP